MASEWATLQLFPYGDFEVEPEEETRVGVIASQAAVAEDEGYKIVSVWENTDGDVFALARREKES